MSWTLIAFSMLNFIICSRGAGQVYTEPVKRERGIFTTRGGMGERLSMTEKEIVVLLAEMPMLEEDFE